MRLLIDENVHRQIVDALREVGYQAVWVPEVCPGASDEEVLAQGQANNQVVLTSDRGFGTLVRISPDLTIGVVIMRMRMQTVEERLARLLQMLPVVAPHMAGYFAIITPKKLRLCPLSDGVGEVPDEY